MVLKKRPAGRKGESTSAKRDMLAQIAVCRSRKLVHCSSSRFLLDVSQIENHSNDGIRQSV